MKRVLAVIAVLALFTSLLVGCGQKQAPAGQSDQSAAQKQETIVFKLGHVAAATNPWQLAGKRFADIVAEKTGGKIKVEVYSDSQLGGEKDMAEGIQMGTVDMAILGTGTLGKLEPKMDVFGLPYLFRDRDHLLKVLNGPVGKGVLDDMVKDTGIRGLAYWERDPRHLTNSKRPVAKPEDVKGLKIRTPGEEMSMDIWKAMGAGPVPMAFGELFTALQQKVVDGQENPLTIINASKFYEVQKYLTLTYHTWAPAVLTITEKKFSKLSPEYQKILVDAAAEAGKYNAELVEKAQTELLKDLEAKGMQVIKVDTKLFAAATKDVHLKYDSRYGKDLYETIINVK